MEKMGSTTAEARPRTVVVRRQSTLHSFGIALLSLCAFASLLDLALRQVWSIPYLYKFRQVSGQKQLEHQQDQHALNSPFGVFPRPGDPFRFIPCTNTSQPPALDDDDHEATWAKLFDPDPHRWNWGNKSASSAGEDPFAGRGVYLCGYLDVPLDYLNTSESRIVRLGVAKFQVSGLARLDGSSPPGAGIKSNRTLVLEPGGPGGSGISMLWGSGERLSQRFTEGAYDTLGWDPRGVNSSQPAISCFPYDADRDRWSMLTTQYREATADPDTQLRVVDAMNNATFHACFKRHGDLGRFMTTALVARDLEEIRVALDEDDLTGYLVSYGTGIGQTYVSMFPERAGRVILDGTEFIRDHRQLGGFVSAKLCLYSCCSMVY